MTSDAVSEPKVRGAGGDDRGLRVLAQGLGFTEGPVVLHDGDFAVTSITLGAVFRVFRDGGAEPIADVGRGANAATVDRDGVLYVAQNGGRWAAEGPAWPPSSIGGVQRVQPDGSVQWLATDPISPNDLCFGPDGLLYVTDPTRSPHIRDGRVWRIHPETGAAELLLSMPWFCNGIAFGPDDRLYLASTYDQRIYAAEVRGGTLSEPRVAIQVQGGSPDGIAFDSRGRLVVGAIVLDRSRPGTIQTYSEAGELVDEYSPGEDSHYTNIAFDGLGGLVITSSDEGSVLLAASWGDPGLPLHPFRGVATTSTDRPS